MVSSNSPGPPGEGSLGDRRATLAAQRVEPAAERTAPSPLRRRIDRDRHRARGRRAGGRRARGRRAGPPGTPRRRAEVAVGRALGHRWVLTAGVVLIMALLLANTSLLNSSINIADGGNSRDQAGQRSQPSANPANPAQLGTSPSASAATKAAAQEQTRARASAKARQQDARNTKRTSGSTTTPRPGSLAGLSDAASGVGWASGVFVDGGGPSAVKAFGAWRGAGVDVVTDWSARQTWSDVVDPSWLYDEWKNTPYTLALGVAPIPEGDSSATMAGCAAGDYNAQWRQFAGNIKAAGLDDRTVVRLGWEFNGNWYKWSATNPGQFAECWRQIVGTARQIAPKLTWDWNVNRGQGQSVADARKAYPGDAYVDLIGVDSYDQYPGARTEADWQQQYSGAYGLKFWSDFAAAHHKKFSVPEWGVYPGKGSNSGGDNAFYITKMEAFFKAEGSLLAYESYFNESAGYIAASLHGPNQNPSAAAKYQALMNR